MEKSTALILLEVSFLFGVFARSAYFTGSPYIFLLFCLCGCLCAFLLYFKKTFLSFIFLCLVFFIFGIYRLDVALKPSQFLLIEETKQQLKGFVVEDPDVRVDKQLITFLPKGYSQNVLITTTLAQEFFYGDEIFMEGKITSPKNFSDFDYKGYLEMKNIYALSNRPKILILKSHKLNLLKENILKIKYAFAKKISSIFIEPENSLLLGILIGLKKALPESLSETFNRVGLSHIVAVSGFNISIIVSSLDYTAYLVGRRFSFWLSIMFIFAFVILTGASASVIRAGLMGFLLLSAYRFGRLYSVTPIICATAFVMVFINPRILFWDVGFELSFLATAGIVYGVPVLEKLTQKYKQINFIKKIIISSLCAIVATMPVLLLKFSAFSLVALLANILVLPVIPLLMLFGFFAVLPVLGAGSGFLADNLLKYVIYISTTLSNWKYASLEISISPFTFLLFYGFILIGYYFLKLKVKKLKVDKEKEL